MRIRFIILPTVIYFSSGSFFLTGVGIKSFGLLPKGLEKESVFHERVEIEIINF